jgi:hypothetical protein
MDRNNKRKNVPPARGESSKPAKRQRKPSQIFEQGVNPAPPTPPLTIRRPDRSRVLSWQCNRDILSPIFEPEAPSQLATDTANILREDEDEDEAVDTTADDEDGPVEFALRAATAEEDEGVSERAAGGARDLPSVAVAASAAQSSQRQRLELQNEEIDEEPHVGCGWTKTRT